MASSPTPAISPPPLACVSTSSWSASPAGPASRRAPLWRAARNSSCWSRCPRASTPRVGSTAPPACPHAHRPLRARPRRAPDARGAARRRSARFRSLSGRMIRTAWFYLVLVWSSVIHAGGVLIAALLGVKRRPGVGAGGIYDWGASDWARDLIAAAGTPVEVEGLERIPRDQPVVYASNHSSMFDIWALAA